MRLFQRNKVFWFELIYDGQRIQRSTKSKNKKVASEIASAFHTALIKGEVGITEKRKLPALDEAMKAFLDWSKREHSAHPATQLRYATSSKPLMALLGAKTKIGKISAEDVENYKVQRSMAKVKLRTGKVLDRTITPATVNRELACLRAMFNHHMKGHPALQNPVDGVKFLTESADLDRVLTFAEQRKYLEVATPVLRDVATIILETGMRPEEVYGLSTHAVDVEQGYLKVLKGKTKAARRRVELNPVALEIVQRRVDAIEHGYLFPKKGDLSKHIRRWPTPMSALFTTAMYARSGCTTFGTRGRPERQRRGWMS